MNKSKKNRTIISLSNKYFRYLLLSFILIHSVHLAKAEEIDTVFVEQTTTYKVQNQQNTSWLYWKVTNGEIISENPSKTDSVVILWNITGIGELSVYEETKNNCIGKLVHAEILIIEKEPTDYQIDLSIPNIFTPNGDGKNDYFTIVTDYSPENYVIYIKNRWGRKVFETQDINNNWDGMINGEYCSEGVYYYIIQYQNQGKREQKNGFVHLYR